LILQRKEPLEFTLGQGIDCRDLKRVNRYENKREKRLPFQKEAYGESREDLIQEVDKSQLPEDITPG
jgi:FKBP-type peptidyl-prolyl cis-trans isomerase SlpA